MNFKPLGERVLVERTEVENKTASGIIIPDNAKEKPQTAKVIAVGSKVEDVKVGDTIVFEQYRGTEIKLEGKDYLVLNVENIIGVM
ncbi:MULTISPECIES: co-chaperone GroES [Aliarcobacter]|jgi:chaperonin GroES|uniref:Co-chaperonin GroES n=6 Tax=Arcobacteraceae TaxID=2808963 RepID=A0A2S9TQZ4_9BACT|nr:co-chaperone GroES [Aliarcobacter cryaerophilus]NCB12536.1 co-chaperone GroES [Erysipelotrichia bacterium]OQA75924.1 MAG: 10 kDa chaperonin 1 [Candidatus Dependentiae bacterium ADurb.Bin246]WNL13109.1 co-chaperone GroES [Arcobacter sp. AZ-2023]WPD02474.1 co-chaperone GroES [Arcobacter sp. DSM 115972]WPD06553.1 co-chaperone GroES [Arcobacter sp. DSM 115956]WPD08644.1 co-chaperone GroES [Arcobacter sp. DSM 115955]WPD09593.1 co-chaperone GroES [Arcobacter sp. DSM 115954]